MLRLKVTIELRGVPNERTMKAALQAGFLAAAEHYRSVIIPAHFEPFAHQKYSYRPRSRKYLARKQRMAQAGQVQKGGKADLVFTGTMERYAEQLNVVKPAPGPSAEIVVQTPSYAKYHNKLFELRRTTPGEESQLNRIAATKAQEKLNELIRTPLK